MPAKFKPTNPWIKKEMAAHNRALKAKTFAEIRNGLEPGHAAIYVPWNVSKTTKTYRKELTTLYLYAAELGKKKGLLPDDCSGFIASGGTIHGDGKATVFFNNSTNGRSAVVQLENLNWTPAPPIEETIDDDLQMAA